MSDEIEFLRRIPFLKNLPQQHLEKMASRILERRYSKGAVVCREGECCDGFWMVKEGSVNTVKLGSAGKVTILETCAGGAACGMISLLDGGGCPASVEAREPTTLLYFPRAELFALVREVPDLGLAIAANMANRLRRFTGQVASVCLQSVRARVAALLIDEARERGERQPDGTIRVSLPGSQEELAHRVGTEREVFARALRALRDENVIQQQRGRVSVTDMDRLVQLARP